jgi:hypothetical protein
MSNGKLVIHIMEGMEASLLEDLLFEIKSGEHKIDTIGWMQSHKKPVEFTITFKEGKKP